MILLTNPSGSIAAAHVYFKRIPRFIVRPFGH